MDKKHNHTQHYEHEHHSGNGFVLGAVIGGTIALLFSTKKGREILKELSDKGLEALDNVKELKELDAIEEEVAAMDGSSMTAPESPHVEAQTTVVETKVASEPEKKEATPPASYHPVKKFFKGVRRK